MLRAGRETRLDAESGRALGKKFVLEEACFWKKLISGRNVETDVAIEDD
jgi:hypothetical protein